MKNSIRYVFYTFLLLTAALVLLVSCRDEYHYDDKEPEWLGASIYDYLEESGKFNYYLQLVQSASQSGTDYAEILRKTGNKTLFVATDSAFDAFFAANEYGIRSFDQMSDAMKRSILFAGMLDDTYLLEMLSSISGIPPVRGQAMRHVTSLGVLDSLPYEKGNYLPKNPYWEFYKEKGIYVLRDDSRWTMVHFLEQFLKEKQITNEDVSYITNTTRRDGDAFIFGIRVIERDITCKNGYINVLEKLMIPPDNMAQYIRSNQETSLFNRFLERYCAPYYSPSMTISYRATHPEFTDSIFVKKYFTTEFNKDPQNQPKEGLLKYDPGWNSYVSGSLEGNMAAMFVPGNDALDTYFNGGDGKFLKDRYHIWDNVPDNVLNVLLNNHMWTSFVETVPSRFPKIEDKMGTPIGVKPEDIRYANVCSNGITYVTNRVYPPTEYISVIAPVLVGENTRIFNWAVGRLQFDLYLLSMVNKFTFLVPTDEALANYLNPVSIGKPFRERWRFWYDPQAVNVKASVFDYDTGDSLRLISGAEVERALEDIIDNHIIIGELESRKKYYMTKGNATLKIDLLSGPSVAAQGGGNLEQSTTSGSFIHYEMKNGNTYFMNNMLQSPVRSVYSIMQSEPRFSKFFQLCADAAPVEIRVGNQVTIYGGSVFSRDPSFTGIDYNVSFFNTFHYTVYIPTNEAIEKAIADGAIKTWEEINAIDEIEERALETQKLYNFLRYHFQDNSVYISGEPIDRTFETATLNPDTERFYRIRVVGDGSNLSLITNSGGSARVITGDGFYNIMARDYKFNTGNILTARQIETSSFAVVHQVDAVLNY